MTQGLKNKIALVTGAGRGIGKAIAIELSKQGAFIYINYLKDATSAQKTMDHILESGGQASLFPFDLTCTQSCLDAVKSILEEKKQIDLLINNAGIKEDKLLAMMKKEAWQAVIDANLTGFYNVTKPVVKNMLRKRSGRIINITSVAGIIGNAGQVNYSASKAGLIGATKALAKEIANRNITVNAVAPGFIETEMIEGLKLDAILETIPANRLGKPEDVAHLVSFLCSDRASYITGQVIGINGGMI